MSEDNSLVNFLLLSGLILFFFTVAVSIFAWITYGTIQGVFGTLAYLIVGLLNLWPWIIPFAGFVIGILDMLSVFGSGMYIETLNLAHLNHSWMPALWYWLVAIVGMVINLILMLMIISWIKGKKYKKKEPKSNLALVNCNIIDGNRDSKLIKDGVILIKNLVEESETPGLIAAVGTASKIKVPDDHKTIDLNGAYVLPGLINSHCHLTGSGKPMKLMNLPDNLLKNLLKLVNNPLGKMLFFNLMKKNAINALNAGVTTLRTMGDPFDLDIKMRKKIEKGKIIGPRLFVCGFGVCPTGGHGGMMGIVADSTPEIRKRIRENIRKEVDHIKILSTGGVMDAKMVGEAGRPQMTVEEIEAACFEAHRGNIMVATHCESTEGMREALEGGVDTIEHGAEIADDLVPLFKKNPKALRGYTAFSTTLSAGMGLATLPIEVTKLTEVKFENAKLIEMGMIKGLQRAYKEGIKLALGTDASVPYSTHYEVWKEVKYYIHYTGMSPQEAIYIATKGTAETLEIDDVTGSVEVGKSADLQVVPGNPLENIDVLGQVSKVVMQGNLIDNPKVKKVKKLEKYPLTELLEA
jgi:imidazolonepropionase-like amidohydrolase